MKIPEVRGSMRKRKSYEENILDGLDEHLVGDDCGDCVDFKEEEKFSALKRQKRVSFAEPFR